MQQRSKRARSIHFVALGCPKNRVDTERMAGLAHTLGFVLEQRAEEAEVIVVNTCAFITDAVEESIDTVLALAQHKEQGRCTSLVVAGCLTQRYQEELKAELPEVDHFIGTEDLARLGEILSSAPLSAEPDQVPRLSAQGSSFAYLKIAEGCDRQCSFCIIPMLRGPQRSRSIASLREEAEQLVQQGIRELVLVAQDTTAYGRDLDDGSSLSALMAELNQVQGLHWLRLLYAYPSLVNDELLQQMARLERVVPYIDLPLQHVDDGVLRAMRRGYDHQRILQLLQQARRTIPGLHIRATLISGHPGEDEAAHQRLLEAVEAARFEHLGVFPYSPEEEAPSHQLPEQVPTELARARAEEILELQQGISRDRLKALRGRRLEVLVDGPSEESDYLLQGRTAGQAPEIDGLVLIADAAGTADPGDLMQVEVTDSGDYDLIARPCD